MSFQTKLKARNLDLSLFMGLSTLEFANNASEIMFSSFPHHALLLNSNLDVVFHLTGNHFPPKLKLGGAESAYNSLKLCLEFFEKAVEREIKKTSERKWFGT